MKHRLDINFFKAIADSDKEQSIRFLTANKEFDIVKNGSIYLIDAISQESNKIVEVLLDLGVLINYKNEEANYFPITLACLLGNIEIIQLLVKAGATINLRGYDSPLWAAIKSNHIHAANFLIYYGADLNIYIDDTYYNILGIAAANGCLKGVKLLLQSAVNTSLSLESLHIESALHQSALSGEKEIFKYLSAYCLEDTTCYEETLRVGIIRKERRENQFISKFVKAINNDDISCIRELLQQDIDINVFTDNGETLLHLATDRGSLEIVTCLLQSGANHELVSENTYQAPLDIAADFHKYEIVEALLKAGASTTSTNNGKTPLILSLHSYFRRIIDIPRGLVFPSFKTRRERARKVIKLLIKFDSDINFQDANGVTPLMIASQTGDLEIVKLLIESGAKTEVKDANGMSFKDYQHD